MIRELSEIHAALDAGLNSVAFDLVRKAEVEYSGAVELRYLGALACARMGAVAEAEKWLNRIDRDLPGESPLAVDVWGLAGRIAKERYAATADKSSEAAAEFAQKAIDCYRHAFSISGAAYPAVNAATMAMLSGQSALARPLAMAALDALGSGDDHWRHATEGEARLILGEIDSARNCYGRARELAGTRYGDVASMRRQLLLIATPQARELLAAVPAPRVIAFSGHMLDRSERAAPRFPASLEKNVAAAIRHRLASLGPAIGYAQAACGADILFLEAMQDAGMQTNVILPFAKTDFTTSVDFAGPGWTARFERVLERATRVVLATEEPFLDSQALFEHAANLIHGMALLHARELMSHPLMLTVREPGSLEIAGGTVANVAVWRQKGGEVDEIDLAALRGETGARAKPAAAGKTRREGSELASIPRSLKTLLFADISGFSRLSEQHTPKFVGMFLETCKKLLDVLDYEPADANTRGDALFMVFDLPSQAAEYAVRLQQAVGRIDWPVYGLDADTGVRIGLHTGPVYRIYDPVMGKPTFYGTHVNRTARLEPVVQPGHIFVTEAFAASLVADDEGPFNCQYIGAMPLAKKFGEARLYRLA